MIDVKKFVVAFLVLAALASSSALVFTSIGSNPPHATASQITLPTPIPGNAFAPASTNETETDAATVAAASALSDPNNITSHFADSLLVNIAAANPDGPRTDASGNQVIATPSLQSILNDMNASGTVQNLQVPDWDFDAARITTRIATSSTSEDVSRYSDALNGITNTYLVKTNLQGIVNNPDGGTLENVAFVSSQIGNALASIGGLTVPKDLVDFHKSLVKILVYEKNALDLTENAGDDPAKASLIFQTETAKYNLALQEFQNAMQNAAQNKAFTFAAPQTEQKGGALGFLQNALGIPTAHAQWIVFDPTTFMQMIWEFLQSILLQILKNTVVALLQGKVLTMVQNGGNPKFIQNWTGLLFKAFNGAAGSVLGQITPGLCDHFSPQIQAWLKNVYSTTQSTPGGFSLNGAGSTNCALQGTVKNVPAYYDDFGQGGWSGYGQLLLPSNNPFGAFAEAVDSVQAVAGAQAAGSKNNAAASQGYSNGAQFCGDGSKPNPADGSRCDDGSEPFNTFPGANLADTIGRNINSSIDLIVNANDITGLLASIAGSLLQQIIISGVNGIAGAAQPQNGQGPPPQALPVACHNSQTVASTTQQVIFSATGGVTQNYTWAAPGGNPTNGAGQVFSTAYFFPGAYTVTVTNVDPKGGNTTATCNVTIQ
jgi:hypothetical protein